MRLDGAGDAGIQYFMDDVYPARAAFACRSLPFSNDPSLKTEVPGGSPCDLGTADLLVAIARTCQRGWRLISKHTCDLFPAVPQSHRVKRGKPRCCRRRDFQ